MFKGRFFSSKKSDPSSPEGSNSPRSLGSNSSNTRSEKKKVKSTKTDPPPITSTTNSTSACSGSAVRFSAKKQQQQQSSSVKKKDNNKDAKGKESFEETTSQGQSAHSGLKVSPIVASSLGLNRIKTRSGPLPQESFFVFSKGQGGSSNLSKPPVASTAGDDTAAAACSSSSLGSGSGVSRKKKMGSEEEKDVKFGGYSVIHNNSGSNSDRMSTESGPTSTDHSPLVQNRSRLRDAESSSEAAGK